MKKLTADEFATKVMATGTEIECDNGVWMIYAHLTADGDTFEAVVYAAAEKLGVEI